MAITERIRNRLDALFAIVKPANSIAARIDSLTDEQREYFEWYKARCDLWMIKCKAQCDDDEREGRPYARMLDGFGPTLRDDVHTALYDYAARIFKDYCDG
jgi:hypothetical protein